MMADAGFRSVVAPLHADYVASIRPVLLLLQAGAMTLLLIGAVNLVNLLLIRANGRVKELAVRRAGRRSAWHLVSEVIVETCGTDITGRIPRPRSPARKAASAPSHFYSARVAPPLADVITFRCSVRRCLAFHAPSSLESTLAAPIA